MGRIKKLVWVRYSARDWLAALSGVSPLAELAHRRLMDLVWAGGEWPVSEPQALARLARLKPPAFQKLLPELHSLGWHEQGGRWQNAAVGAVHREAAGSLAAKRQASRIANQVRWRPQGPPNGLRTECPRMPDADRPESTVHVQEQHIEQADNNGERLTLAGSARKKGLGEPEQEFLAEVKEVMERWRKGSAAVELDAWGGWWRTAFRNNPRKARAVLREAGALAKEGRITASPGAAALDLWKRLP